MRVGSARRCSAWLSLPCVLGAHGQGKQACMSSPASVSGGPGLPQAWQAAQTADQGVSGRWANAGPRCELFCGTWRTPLQSALGSSISNRGHRDSHRTQGSSEPRRFLRYHQGSKGRVWSPHRSPSEEFIPWYFRKQAAANFPNTRMDALKTAMSTHTPFPTPLGFLSSGPSRAPLTGISSGTVACCFPR